MLRPDDSLAWLEMLFRPGELFEVRLKRPTDEGALRFWYTYERIPQLVNTNIPIHTEQGFNIWVGVSPRPAIRDSSPTTHRALWCDFAGAITTRAQVDEALAKSELPAPTMIVNSGNGYHAYWQLDDAVAAKDAAPHVKAVHRLLPTDTTHDSARVMRLPGTINPKGDHLCFIEEHHPERSYTLSDFPQAAEPKTVTDTALTHIHKPISEHDFDLFVASWLPGQRHNFAVGVAGYLRKNLNYDEERCLDEIRRIHEASGYSWEADKVNLTKVVRDTYAKPLGLVAGTQRLAEYGVMPEVTSHLKFTFVKPKPPKIRVIDFKRELKPQEFWIDGLVGPGLTTLWAAEPKTGKSYAAMQIGHALANGLPLWDFNTDLKPHPTLYFQVELSQGMVYDRAQALFPRGTYENPEQFAMTDKPDETFSLSESPDALLDLAERYDVVIVDPISQLNSNDENSVNGVKDTLAVFDRLRRDGKAVILVHHTRKLAVNRDGTVVPPSMSDVRGSGQWFAMPDALALQYRIGETNTRVKFMFRAAPDREPLTLYRLQNGGFTHDRHEYLAEHGQSMRINIPFDKAVN